MAPSSILKLSLIHIYLASRTDVNEAYAVGGAAAAAAFAGETGRMIALKRISAYPYQCITESVDVQQVANLEKKVPLDWISPDGMQVTAAFEPGQQQNAQQ